VVDALLPHLGSTVTMHRRAEFDAARGARRRVGDPAAMTAKQALAHMTGVCRVLPAVTPSLALWSADGTFANKVGVACLELGCTSLRVAAVLAAQLRHHFEGDVLRRWRQKPIVRWQTGDAENVKQHAKPSHRSVGPSSEEELA
jgi:hypothetical protein